jgi:cupin 2 domain-containing protein
MPRANLFVDIVPPATGERFETLLAHGQLVIERIVSSADLAPHTYLQPQDEWVVLLQGEATLQVDGRPVVLAAGDHLFLPAGTPHSVERALAGSLWLAVHLHPANKD